MLLTAGQSANLSDNLLKRINMLNFASLCHRQQLGSMTAAQAEMLLGALAAPNPQGWTAALQLLARWTQQLHTQASEDELRIARRAVDACLGNLAAMTHVCDMSSSLSAATITFLGSAVRGTPLPPVTCLNACISGVLLSSVRHILFLCRGLPNILFLCRGLSVEGLKTVQALLSMVTMWFLRLTAWPSLRLGPYLTRSADCSPAWGDDAAVG